MPAVMTTFAQGEEFENARRALDRLGLPYEVISPDPGYSLVGAPALALLLAGPALSLPSMLVLRSVLGTKKTVVYVSLVIVMATITGMIYGAIFG